MAVGESLQNIFRIPELKKRILFTLGMFAVYRFGCHVPSPGVDAQALTQFMNQNQGTLFGMIDIFVGGAFSRATVFALGIMPYISASIVLQVLGAVVPYLEKLRKEGEEGQKKINQLTRYGTVLIALVNSYAFGLFLTSNPGGMVVVPNPGIGFMTTLMITQVAGTIFVMWLGEQITERGIGNGISLLITISIIADAPSIIGGTIASVQNGVIQPLALMAGIAFFILVVAGVVILTQGTRKIPVQYAKRVVGRRMYGGASTYIPLRVNTAGVIPIIFASSLLILPATLAQFFPNSDLALWLQSNLGPGINGMWELIYGVGIFFFTYFYTAVVLNPNDLAENMRKYGGFIPGIRPGRKTAEYIDRVLSRITVVGALGLVVVAIVPDLVFQRLGLPLFVGLGGTSVLIVVAVALDTLQQVESHLLTRHYEGFVKKGRLRGRRG
jgi:preprotein translocase subunit SecY